MVHNLSIVIEQLNTEKSKLQERLIQIDKALKAR
jgi:hypothetical protein